MTNNGSRALYGHAALLSHIIGQQDCALLIYRDWMPMFA